MQIDCPNRGPARVVGMSAEVRGQSTYGGRGNYQGGHRENNRGHSRGGRGRGASDQTEVKTVNTGKIEVKPGGACQ